LSKRTVSGVLWLGVGQGGGYAVRFVVIILLARLLSPEMFGLLGLASAILLILMDVSNMGLSAALVQMDEPDQTDLSTMFWANLALSSTMCVALFAGSTTLARVFSNADLAVVLRVTAFLLPLSSIATIPYVLLQRQLQFSRISLRDVSGEIAFGLVGLPMALLGMGLWALVGAFAAQWVARSLILFALSPWWPSFRLDLAVLRRLGAFGGSAFGVSLCSRIMSQVDYFLIGAVLGAETLGYYTIAFQLAVLPADRLTGVVRRVTFPVFSSVKRDAKRLGSGLSRLVETLAYVMIPFSATIFFLSPVLIPSLYSAKWTPAIVPAQILSLAAAAYGFDVTQAIFFALGKPSWRLFVLGARTILFLGFCALALDAELGITGVALSLVAAVSLTTIVGGLAIRRLVHVEWVDLARKVAWPLLFTAAVLLPLQIFLAWTQLSTPIALTVAGTMAAAAYCLMAVAKLGIVADVRRFLASARGSEWSSD
jgi:PST family polysaccharide transporter